MTRRDFLKIVGIGLVAGSIGSLVKWGKLQGEDLILNETGAKIYKGYKEGRTPEQIASDLVAEYDVDFGTALKDTKEFLALLRSLGV